MRKVYKVVRKDLKGRLASLIAHDPPWLRVYRDTAGRRRCVRRCMAFRTLKHARRQSTGHGSQVWEAVCLSARSVRRVADFCHADFASFQKHDGYKNDWSGDGFTAPVGTLYCKNLRLVRTVD